MRSTLILALVLLFNACAKDNSKRYNQIINYMMECSYDADWSVNSMSDAILGTYEWQYLRAFGIGEYSSDRDFNNWPL